MWMDVLDCWVRDRNVRIPAFGPDGLIFRGPETIQAFERVLGRGNNSRCRLGGGSDACK